jgi:hypothetical protein
MRIALIYIQVRYKQPEGPEVNVSRYTMRPGTLGLTLFYSSRSPNTFVSDTEKRVVNCAVARSVNAVPDSPLIPPCLSATIQICKELSRLGRKLR